jgi:peptide/nickel transport system substrate-binding protein
MSLERFIRPFRSFSSHIARIIASFSHTERVVYFLLLWIFAISAIFVLYRINEQYTIVVPAKGGSYTEGVIGTPRFINPILAISDADRDMTSLVYSGLMRTLPSGELIPDLASSYTLSEDGLTYIFTIRDDAVFHDGTPISAYDIMFTIQKAQDSTQKSPKRANWDGVIVATPDEKTVIFTLSRPYAPFLENTTLGILPKHIWGNMTTEAFNFSEYNSSPIGSGPYTITSVRRDISGLPLYYDLKAFTKYTLGEPYLTHIRMRFYQNEDELLAAFKKGDINAFGAISPAMAISLATNGTRIESSPLPRVFGVFFNHDKATVFTELSVRQALNVSVEKERIVNDILSGYGSILNGPIPPGSLGYQTREPSTPLTREERLANARAILEKAGWTWTAHEDENGKWTKKTKKETTILSFSLATANVPELKAIANIIIENWTALGVPVTLKVFDPNDLNQQVIRPRDYDALLFGEVVGRDTDLFAFWHSSQRNDPGLNIAMYANITADKLLETSRTSPDTTERETAYHKLTTVITNDTPAIFLYTPTFIYALPHNLLGVSVGSIVTSSERFNGILSWHIETDRVWSIFINKDNSEH